VLYLMIIIVAAVAGITRLALQQRRQQKIHLLDDFRSSLERLANQPLPSQGRLAGTSRPLRNRLRGKRGPSPRGDWDRIARPVPAFAPATPIDGKGIDDFFGPPSRSSSSNNGWTDEPIEEAERPVARSPRKKRRPLLAGRLWREPREPWLWTYSKPRRPVSRGGSLRSEAAYVDFPVHDDVRYVSDRGLARSPQTYGSRSPQASPTFAGPHRSARRTALDPARREAAKRRLEVRRRTGTRLS
jgi:hypothetical protein